MTFEEAMIAIREGKRVRSKSWTKDAYIHFSCGRIRDKRGYEFCRLCNYFNDEFEEYVEEKDETP